MRTSFLLKEVRRFFRSSPLLSVSGVLVLSLSLAVCLLALTMKAALSSMAYPRSVTLASSAPLERICFGATPWRIRRTILARAAVCASLGALLSLPLWVLLSRLSLQGYLGQVSWSTGRSVVIALACVFLSVVVAAAPGNQAVHISPSEVLKEE